MKHQPVSYLLVFLLFFSGLVAAQQAQPEPKPTSPSQTEVNTLPELQQPMYRPLVERYILDELKLLRLDQQQVRIDIAEKLAHVEVEATDRAVTYTTDTVNNVFFIITAAASILVMVGWTSLRDVKSKIEETVEKKVNDITQEYEKRLARVEENLKKRSAQLISAQEEIAKTNEIHSLWMRAGLETHLPTKIQIYDEILKINPDEVEAIAYKADAVLDLGESEWAFNLSNKAIEKDAEYGYAYWQRACANAALGNKDGAVQDIKLAIKMSPHLQHELGNEPAFEQLKGEEEFDALLLAQD